MKHLKTFEKFSLSDRIHRYPNDKYNKGDYILLNLVEINKEFNIVDDNDNFNIDDLAIITDKFSDRFSNSYKAVFYDNTFLDVREEQIKRLLTPEEIINFQAKKDGLKYNL